MGQTPQAAATAATYSRWMSLRKERLRAGLRPDVAQGRGGRAGRRCGRACSPTPSVDVVEIGGGTGANLPFYNGDASSRSSSRSRSRRCSAGCSARRANRRRWRKVLRAPAEDLPFEDGNVRHRRLDARALRRRRPGARAARGYVASSARAGACCSSSTCAPTTPELARFQDRMNWLNRFVVAAATATDRRSPRSRPRGSGCLGSSRRRCRRRRNSSGR